MNYFNNRLPSAVEIQKFRLKKLSALEMEWMDQLIQSNPMVAAAVGVSDDVNLAEVSEVNSAVLERLPNFHLEKIGFWTKYGSWIGLSSIILLIGIASVLYTSETTLPLYSQSSLDLEQVKATPSSFEFETNSVSTNSQHDDTKSTLTIDPEKKSDELNNYPSAKKDTNNPKDTKSSTPTILPANNLNKTPEKSFTRQSENSDNAVREITVAVSNINVLAKLNPDEYKVSRTSNSGADPLNSGGSKSVSKQFSIADLPSFPGGDQALLDYFKGKMTPINSYTNVKFDKAIMLKLVINSRGKLKDYEVLGNIHPDHKVQLEKAIASLPKFNSGKGNKIEYNLGLSFN